MTGGHTDKHVLPVDVVESEAWETQGALCDGVPACLTQVRLNLRQQADVIKVSRHETRVVQAMRLTLNGVIPDYVTCHQR